MRSEKVARDGKRVKDGQRKNVGDEDTCAGGEKKRMFVGNLYDE
jgi:hypothetical protein